LYQELYNRISFISQYELLLVSQYESNNKTGCSTLGINHCANDYQQDVLVTQLQWAMSYRQASINHIGQNVYWKMYPIQRVILT